MNACGSVEEAGWLCRGERRMTCFIHSFIPLLCSSSCYYTLLALLTRSEAAALSSPSHGNGMNPNQIKSNHIKTNPGSGPGFAQD
jgi:hypothetical protein